MRHFRAFTLIELLVVVAIITLLIAIVMPALGAARGVARQAKASAQVRGTHQAMVIDAQGNNSYLTGLGPSGRSYRDLFGWPAGGPFFVGSGQLNLSTDSASRYWILFNGHYIAPDLAVSPAEAIKTKWTQGAVRQTHYSYAMSNIRDAYPGDELSNRNRRAEWKDNANSLSPLIGDRCLGYPQPTSGEEFNWPRDATIQSIWTNTPGDWRGNVVWGDNHAEFLKTYMPPTRILHVNNEWDNLFFSWPSILMGPDFIGEGIIEPANDEKYSAYLLYDNQYDWAPPP